MANYSFKDPDTSEVPIGSVINSGNFTQANPDTPIMVGRPLTINGGNFTNVRQDAAWTINGGNWNQIDRCSHISSDVFMDNGLAVCATECSHMVSKEDITIDGQLVDTVYVYEHTAV